MIARGGMLTALTIVLLYLASVMPAGQVGLCAAAGVVPAAPLSRRRVALGVCVYVASAVLGFLILPKKTAAFAYTAVFGAYTLLKYAIEKLRAKPLQWVCKLGCAGVALGVVLLAAPMLLAPSIRVLPDSLDTGAAFVVAVLLYFVVFVLYDIAFSRLLQLLRRIFPPE